METHHQYAMQAINAGKHVLVEKPTAVTIDEIEDLKNAARAKGVQVAPVHNYIYEPSVTRAKELINSGKIGDWFPSMFCITYIILKQSPPGTQV